MFYLQKSASSFFDERIKSSPEFKDENVIFVDFKLKDQAAEIGKVQSTLIGEITMTYAGKTLDNFSEVLPLVINNPEAEYLLRTLVQNGFFGPSSTSSSIKYDSKGKSLMIADYGYDKYTIIFFALITASSLLALCTLFYFCSTKCSIMSCTRETGKDRDLQITKTEESDGPLSPGILGAYMQSDNQRAIITPQRGVQFQVEETPMSQDSNFSDTKSVFSTTSSKAPLGILSMGNLRKMMFSPERQKHSASLYNVGLDEEEVEELGDDSTEDVNSGAKKV